MRVIIDHRLFRARESASELVQLLQNTSRLPHQIIVDGGGEGELVVQEWLAGHHDWLRPHLKLILAKGRRPEAVRKPPEISLVVTNEEEESVDVQGREAVAHLDRAKDLVREPLKLWLENGLNDSAFLRTITPPGVTRVWLENARSKGWIEYRHGGGSDLGKNLRALGPWERLRAWSMCDSDSWEPGAESRQVAAFREAAAGQPLVPLVVLCRRAIENYLPPPALKCWASLRSGTNREQRQERAAFAEAIACLDAHDAPFNLRHHYHMEKGFPRETEAIPATYGPFRGDPILARGMGRAIKRVFAGNLEIREAGGHGWLEDRWFAQDHSRREIETIVESIQRRI